MLNRIHLPKKIILLSALVMLATTHEAYADNPDADSPQNILIGATPDVQAKGNNGAGIVFGVIDSGVNAAWVGFQGRVNTTKSTCIMTGSSSDCKGSPSSNDDYGHGSFVASEIIGNIPDSGFLGIAPAATAIAVKILDSNGQSTSNSDVSTAIKYAVDHGATVLNLSLGPTGPNNTPLPAAQLVAFYQGLASAVNYAASKNAIIVFAGGNSSQIFAGGQNITGFSDAAVEHIIIMGSTNASKQVSFFSNTPGKSTAGFITKDKHFFSYQSVWMMADGENIMGADFSNVNGLVIEEGTSMTAPQASGAAGLIAARWPYLVAKGTIPRLLETTAQNIGDAATYGDGLLRIDVAMQPVGNVTVPTTPLVPAPANSPTTPTTTTTPTNPNIPPRVTNPIPPRIDNPIPTRIVFPPIFRQIQLKNSSLYLSGPFGNVKEISSFFQNKMEFDSFGRNFSVNLSSYISPQSSSNATSTTYTQLMNQGNPEKRNIVHLSDTSWAEFTGSTLGADSLATTISHEPIMVDPSRIPHPAWSFATQQDDHYMGVGHGGDATMAFSDARWGEKTAFSSTNNDASGTLMQIVPDANFAAIGMDISDDSRVAFGLVTGINDTMDIDQMHQASANAASMAYTYQATDAWKVSLSTTFLSEHNMLLGSISNGAFYLGKGSNSTSFGVGSTIQLGDGYKLGLDAEYVTTSGSVANSVINDTSRLSGAAFGMMLTKDDLTGKYDSLTFSAAKPLRLYSGTADVSGAIGVDSDGNPIMEQKRISLVPNGNETDFGLTYKRPLGDNITGTLSFVYHNDDYNVAGQTSKAALLRFNMPF